MKRYFFTILVSLIFFAPSFVQAQEKNKGTCLVVEGIDHDVCFDFRNSWYYTVRYPTGWVLAVREINDPSSPHIWNGGQYFITNSEMDKLKSALSGMGLGTVCPQPDYRMRKDKLTPRDKFCKK